MNPIFRASYMAILASAVLSACDDREQPVPELGSRPVKTFLVTGGKGGGKRNFPARIDSTYRAELAFRVAGTVQDIPIKEGDEVEEGQLLATLDPTDYQTVVRDRQATFDNNKRNFERARDLIGDGFISRTEYDSLEANFKTSEAALISAQQDLAYTELKAPFEGRVAKRHVERFEDIGIKQTMFSLQDVKNLLVQIDLPESLLRRIRANPNYKNARRDSGDIPAFVTFEGRPDQPLPLTVREVSTRADPKTQTFEVTFDLPAPKDFIVLPGMTATVSVDFSRRMEAVGQTLWAPINAVVADSALGARVWILDEQSMTVSSTGVEVGRMQGDQVEILSGLGGGEEIISVGASYLAEGMSVTRMKTSEQAVPRPGDPG